MNKKLSKDVDMFNMSKKEGIGNDSEIRIPDDIFWLGSAPAPKEEAPADDKKPADTPPAEEKPEETPPADDPKDTPPKEETPEEPAKEGAPADTPGDTTAEENEIEKLIREAGQGLQDIKDDPSNTPEQLKKLQEALDLNDELSAKVESLTRQLDVAREQTNKNLETGEEMRIYQPLIQKLEKDPQLMLLAKHYGTKNDTMKERVTQIVKDMLHDLTGIDIYALMDKETMDKATAFWEASTEVTPPAIDTPEKAAPAPGYTRKKDKTFPI